MKKLIGVLVGLAMLCGVSLAYTTQSTYEATTATTESITIITFEATADSILILNDSSTSGEDIRINLEHDLSIGRITGEAFELKPGENVTIQGFKTRRIFLISDQGAPNYRVWTLTN